MNHYTLSTFWDSRVCDSSSKESRVMMSVLIEGINTFSFAIRNLRCTRSDYERSFSSKSLSDLHKKIKGVITSAIDRGESILQRLGADASKESFQRLYKSNTKLSTGSKSDAYAYIDTLVSDLKNENRFGSAANTYNASNSFKMYKSKLNLEDVNDSWIKGYKKFMVDNGRSISTTNIYLRVMRSIIKECMKSKVLLIDKNPFDEVSLGWTVKSSKDILYPVHLKALWEYEPVGVIETRAKDFFFLCYCSNGMNFRDVSLLRNKNLKTDRFVFVRSKTSTTQINAREITVYINDELRCIIDKYRTTSTKPDAFLFDIFNCKDEKHHNATFIRYKRQANKALNKISASLKINRAYLGIARHSFATKLKIDGVASSHISEFLGHANENTTAAYLKSLPDAIHTQMNRTLLTFK